MSLLIKTAREAIREDLVAGWPLLVDILSKDTLKKAGNATVGKIKSLNFHDLNRVQFETRS